MRTTLTLDLRLDQLLKQAALDAGVSFKKIVNDTLQAGLQARAQAKTQATAFQMPVFNAGGGLVDLTKATALAGELEDLELIEKHQRMLKTRN